MFGLWSCRHLWVLCRFLLPLITVCQDCPRRRAQSKAADRSIRRAALHLSTSGEFTNCCIRSQLLPNSRRPSEDRRSISARGGEGQLRLRLPPWSD